MQSLKTTCSRQIFALAKPHDSSGGKKTRNRIPKEERKTLVESFIKKHQKSNNGSFPSLSLTHKEVGGSFYTIREIVREIIQENRVLGAGDLGSDRLQDQSLSVVMDPVPPLSLPPNGFHSVSEGNYHFSFDVGEDKSPANGEMKATHLSKEDVGMLVHPIMGTTDISKTQIEASCIEENATNRYAGLLDSLATEPQGKELDVDDKDTEIEGILFTESEGTKAINNDGRVNDAETATSDMVNMTKNTLGTTDLPAETLVETFPVTSVTSSSMEVSDVQPSELDKVCEGEKGTDAKVETDSSSITSVDLFDIPSSTSAVSEEQATKVDGSQMPNHKSVPTEKNIEEKTTNPALADVEYADTKETVVANPDTGNIHETKEFINGTLTINVTESGSSKNGIPEVKAMSSRARKEVTNVEKAAMEEGKPDGTDSSSSQKGNNATLNRIKPESWKGQSNMAGKETNPLLAALKSFLTAFVKFWSE